MPHTSWGVKNLYELTLPSELTICIQVQVFTESQYININTEFAKFCKHELVVTGVKGFFVIKEGQMEWSLGRVVGFRY